MNTIRRYAADDAHVIYGTAYDEALGDELRVTVIATGLSPGQARAQQAPMQRGAQRAGAAHRHRQRAGRVPTPARCSRPAPARPARLQRHGRRRASGATAAPAAAKVDALASDGMDEFEIPAFLRKQAD